VEELEPIVKAQAGKLEKSVYGIVDKIHKNGRPHIVRRWKGTIGNMKPTKEKPTILMAEKLEPVILKHKKYKLLYGGRAGTKSIAAMDIMIGEVNSNGSGVFCLREQMKSLSQSIYRGINKRIQELNFKGFNPVESKWKIDHKSKGIISFGGLKNVEDMKSLIDYKFFLLEESANTSQETIDILGPTLRGVEGAELWYLWNPKSSNDPMSKEFIIPYQAALDRDGYYEDEYHLIINVSFLDNPWFASDKSLSTEYEKDKQKKEDGRMSAARFNHIWHGSFNDDVENSLIDADWFDACIDAHKKLGFAPKGAKVVTHDPADVGDDSKAVALRHGVVFTSMEELEAQNANIGIDMACGFASNHNADAFGWDCDGLGAPLRNQVEDNFKGKAIRSYMFKGSESVHNPDAVFSAGEDYGMSQSKLNKDVFRNKRAQNYANIAQRCRKTYEAVNNGVYYNPDDLISFSSEIECLQKLRSELCRMPLKANGAGMIMLYTKEDMRRGIILPNGQKLKLPSPNLADCVMMSFDPAATFLHRPQVQMPPALKTIGRR
tara:strand:+ start:3383 stop:5026 length:1644 start_codon:yes stop_codon:yes gene_type:complete